MTARSHVPPPQAPRTGRLAGLVFSLISVLLPPALGAAPQAGEKRIRREVVVLGSEPGHRRVILDRLADRGYLGVHLLELTPELRRHFGAPEDRGILVSRVAPDSPAAAAGVEVGDLIVSADGTPVRTTGQLVGRVGPRQAGERIELGIVRDRAALTVRATLARSERRQVEIGQFVWRGDGDGPLVVDLDPEALAGPGGDAEVLERVITIDPETINESVSRLLARLEARGEAPGALRLDGEQRRRLEERIAELEERLRELERRLHRRRGEE